MQRNKVILDLVERVGPAEAGQVVEVPLGPGQQGLVERWCERAGHRLLAVEGDVATIRRGPIPDDDAMLDEIPVDRQPGARLWIYTNFDCNLACDYCCAKSSPQAERRALGPDRIRELVAEGAEHGVTEIFLTGGEPFLLWDLDEIVAACAARAPTTILTNGMLFRGRRLDMLRAMPRADVALQISLDSATAELHDLHRGAGSWQRALDGIRTALREGFRVRVAATVAAGEAGADEIAAFHSLLDGFGIDRDDQVIRPVAHRGFADDGVTLTIESLVPEVTVTADGIYWHPVTAGHEDQLVSRSLFPLGDAIAEVRRRFAAYRWETRTAAQRFTCA
ncbi:radical SAM protein [Actinobacteria bacterium YIM 96077]|uniref:Radical SAM protein n=1 Tax=Phytoactinopolyspora halophila TaxID=1981511 RepID=A0A329QRX9_9ACTN|nr:radical SAM protein [Phytoactinopolyspora halophila]AYY15673.1 radical SAM protein [Actinobacteria bacterium YIM 96077]RAW14142.1 radical SAM protein [Phytoactinopolyspora halophila]